MNEIFKLEIFSGRPFLWTGKNGEDADDPERGERVTDDAVLRRPAGLPVGGSVARRPGSVRRRHVALLRLSCSEATRLRHSQRQFSTRMPRGDVHVGDALLPPPRLHHHHDVDAGEKEPRRSGRHSSAFACRHRPPHTDRRTRRQLVVAWIHRKRDHFRLDDASETSRRRSWTRPNSNHL